MKKIIIMLVTLVLLSSCGSGEEWWTSQSSETQVIAENEKVQVITSIVPLASITNYIGWEQVVVNNLVPVGASPHGFDLTPQNMINIQKSDIVFMLWIQDIDGFLFKSLSWVKSIALDAGLKVLEPTSTHDHSDHEEEWEGHIHAEASIDTHVWNGKVNPLLIAKKIQEQLTELQPSQKALFQANYEKFETELTLAFQKFQLLTQWKTQKEFIVFHDAYNYLFVDAGIDMDKKLIFKSNVMSNTSSSQMKELTDEVKLHGVSEFFVEPQFDDKTLRVFAEENNGKIHKLDPLWVSEEADGFIQTLNSNLQALSHIYE